MTRFLSLYLTAIFVLVGCRIYDEDCPAIYAPVCGQDGVTYGNDCYARNAGATQWSRGGCDCIDESKISDEPCYEIAAPVCGCDGITYDNDCYAINAGITYWIEGECDSINLYEVHDLFEI
tara:strand:+ start:165 stop:527 length:363 start_codon:yes stop_codon:yes gene_type:complete